MSVLQSEHMIGEIVGFALENAGDPSVSKIRNVIELTFECLSMFS